MIGFGKSVQSGVAVRPCSKTLVHIKKPRSERALSVNNLSVKRTRAGALARSLRAPARASLRLLYRKGGHTLRQRPPRASSSRSAAALLVAKPLAAHLNCCAQPGVASARTPLSRAISDDTVRIWALDRRYNRVTDRLGGHDAEEKVERTSRQPLLCSAAKPW